MEPWRYASDLTDAEWYVVAAHCGAFISAGSWSQRWPALHDDTGQSPLCEAAMAERETKAGDLYKELDVTRKTLYRFVGPTANCDATARSCSSARPKTSVNEARAPHHAGSNLARHPACAD
jgi:hypothetical protein